MCFGLYILRYNIPNQNQIFNNKSFVSLKVGLFLNDLHKLADYVVL